MHPPGQGRPFPKGRFEVSGGSSTWDRRTSRFPKYTGGDGIRPAAAEDVFR